MSTHDLNLSLDLVSEAFLLLPCIVCSSIMFLCDHENDVFRLMHGAELLQVQGFPASRLAQKHEHGKLVILSGNAFSAFHFLAAFQVAFTTLQDLTCFSAASGERGGIVIFLPGGFLPGGFFRAVCLQRC